mgnify:CR=1 FL=1
MKASSTYSTDVHSGALSDGFKTLENNNVVAIVAFFVGCGAHADFAISREFGFVKGESEWWNLSGGI